MPKIALRRIIENLKKVQKIIYRRLYISRQKEQDVVKEFHELYFDSKLFSDSWSSTSWLGVRIRKCPLDLWIYQEMIYELKPDWIIECGTADGGSALYLASLCDLLDHGQIITVDIESKKRPAHDRIHYVKGSSVDCKIVKEIEGKVKGTDRILIILDSDHSKDHVLKELEIYKKFVAVNGYLIVEDTNINGHPVAPNFGPGPMEAVEEFLTTEDRFTVDTKREKFLMTCNPKGYLKRVK